MDALDVLSLPRAEPFRRVQAPDALKQTLPPQHLVQARDAAGKAVRRVEEGCIAVGDLSPAPQQFGRDGATG